MNSQPAIRRTLSLTLALSVALWAANAAGVLSAGDATQCHARMQHVQHQAEPMPCCPSHAASLPVSFFTPPPCCDLSNQPAPPLAFVVMPGKFQAGLSSAIGAAGAMVNPPERSATIFPAAASPPFVKPVFDRKTDLRI